MDVFTRRYSVPLLVLFILVPTKCFDSCLEARNARAIQGTPGQVRAPFPPEQ